MEMCEMNFNQNRSGMALSAFSAVLAFLLGPAHFSIAHADNFSKRAYVGIGVGVTEVDPESSTTALAVSDDSDTGAHLALGYDINRFLTVEGYIATLGTAEVEFLGTDAGSIDYTVYGVSLLGYFFNSQSGLVFGDDDVTGLYRREGASLYGRFGIGHLENDAERVEFRRDNPNHAVFGLGLEYGFSNGIALRAEATAYDTDARYFNVGILKRFGDASSGPLLAAATPIVPAVAVLDEPEEPAAALPEVVAERNKFFSPIQPPKSYFAVNMSDLTPEIMRELDEYVVLMQSNSLRMQVQGHTDSIGPEAYNIVLSTRRAEAVADHIAGKGIDRNRVTIIGYGEARPASENDSKEGRALNRRTEIELLSPVEPQASL